MGITGRAQNSYTMDALTQLKDAGAITASAACLVGGVARVLDFGFTTPQGVIQVAYVPGDIVIDVSAIEVASTDEVYMIAYELSDDTSGNAVGFDAGDVVVCRGVVMLGCITTAAYLAGLNMDTMSGTGRIVLGVDNEVQGTLYRYARLATYIAGTIATGINYAAFLSRLG